MSGFKTSEAFHDQLRSALDVLAQESKAASLSFQLSGYNGEGGLEELQQGLQQVPAV